MATTPSGYHGLAGFHKYWGKKPVESWQLLIDQLTDKGDTVLDPFLGSGLIAKECIGKERKFIGFDINPVSLELSKLFLSPPSHASLKQALDSLYGEISVLIDNLYRTQKGDIVSHFLWENKKIQKAWKKEGRSRVELELTKKDITLFEEFEMVRRLSYSFKFFENSRINSKSSMTIDELFSQRALYGIDVLLFAIQKYESGVQRALKLILTAALGQMSNMVFAVTKRGKTKGEVSDQVEVGSWTIGYWQPNQHFEINMLNCYKNKADKLLKALKDDNPADFTEDLEAFIKGKQNCLFQLGDSEKLLKELPNQSVQVILTDPPHGDRIPYLELSEIWNGFLDYPANMEDELIISNAKERGKDKVGYNEKLANIFAECERVLTDDGVMAVMFNARSKEHWSSLNALSAINYVGCYPLHYSAGSVFQDNRKGGLKTDFVLLFSKKESVELSNKFSDFPGWSSELPVTSEK